MSRILGGLLLFAAIASAGDPLLDEMGLAFVQQVDKGIYKVMEYRFKDNTGALAASFAIPNSVRAGNYVLTCEGKCPKVLPPPAGYREGALSVLPSYLPQKGLEANSERYVLGPVGLSQTAPEIPAAAAAFQFGTEAVFGKYRQGPNEPILAIFMYPTPQMARQQLPQFQKVEGALVKRSGPVVAVALHAADEASASSLLKDIEYQASISWDEQPPLIIRPQTAAKIVLGAMELAGFILVFCLLSGLAYGGIRVLRQRFGMEDADEGMIALHLSGK